MFWIAIILFQILFFYQGIQIFILRAFPRISPIKIDVTCRACGSRFCILSFLGQNGASTCPANPSPFPIPIYQIRSLLDKILTLFWNEFFIRIKIKIVRGNGSRFLEFLDILFPFILMLGTIRIWVKGLCFKKHEAFSTLFEKRRQVYPTLRSHLSNNYSIRFPLYHHSRFFSIDPC